MGASNLMPIGRFARSCRLSVKALRHYDELGLLAPAFVDPSSGYRYYAREQARDAVMIGMLRSLDLPLAVIRSALGASPGDLKALLQTETARIRAEVSARERALLSLQHIARAGSLAPAEIEIRALSPRRVARKLATTDPERLVPDSTELIYALLEEVRDQGVTVGEVLTINEYSDDESEIRVQACVGFDTQARSLPGAEIVDLPGGSFACLLHVGPYETLGLAHHALFAWVQERGHEAAGPIWEFYRNDPADVSAEELATDVALLLVAP